MQSLLRGFLLFYIILSLVIPNGAIAAETVEKESTQASSIFTDVPVDDPNYIFANYLSKCAIMNGFADGAFHPNEGLTRAQAAVIAVKAANLPIIPADQSSFKDVPAAYWAANYVVTAEKAGYLRGFSDNTFRPEAKLTRAQGISLLMRLSTQKERAELPALQDMNGKHWAAKDMATALQLNMISTDSGGKLVYPEADMTRGSLARALSLLLIKDPGLNRITLTGNITEVQGNINLTRGSKVQALKNGMNIVEGDMINSAPGSKARLVYPDGSSTLIEENSQLVFKKSQGKKYIKQDGTPGVAVDFLNIDVKGGTVFGALATKQGGENTPGNAKQANRLSSMVASKGGLRQVAAAQVEQSQPWYKTAQKKKVKVQVDMPWGVAAVRGTFYKVTVYKDGTCKVSCLTGNMELSGTNGAMVALGANQTSSINSANGAPAAAAVMDANEIQAFNQEQQWILETAIQIDVNREAMQIVVNVASDPSSLRNSMTTLQVIINALQASGVQINNDLKASLQKELDRIEREANNPYQGKDIQSQLGSGSQNNGNSTNNHSSSSSSGSESLNITYNEPGTYGPENASLRSTYDNINVDVQGVTLRNINARGNVVVNQTNTVFTNVTIDGFLLLGSGIAEGDVTLTNCKVSGTTTINGGGSASIHLVGCTLYTVTVDKENNSVRIVAEGSTSVGALTLNSGATLVESGISGTGFSSIIAGSGIPADAQIILSGSFDSLNIDVPHLNITLQSGSINAVTIGSSAADTTLNLAAGTSVNTLTANAAAIIAGSGAITNAVINANGVEIAQIPLNWSISEGIRANIGGESISESGATDACDIDDLVAPDNAAIANRTITANVGYSTETVTINPVVSDYASWVVYSDQACTAQVDNNLELDCGANTYYIKVTAKDGTTNQVYTLIIDRQEAVSTACEVLSIANVSNPSIGEGAISSDVTGAASSLTVDVSVSEYATWKLYSNAACTTEIGDKTMTLNYGPNIAYIKVIAENGSSQIYTLTVTRVASSNAGVATVGTAYTVGENSIAANAVIINTNLTAADFLSNLTKDAGASWKVVNKDTTVTNSTDFDAAAAKAGSDTLLFGDTLAVKAEDGTVKVYTITVVLGIPVVGAGAQPPAPGGLRIIPPGCNGFVWGKYRYFAYDFIDDNTDGIMIVAFDKDGNIAGQWQRSDGTARFVTGNSITVNAATVTFSTSRGNGLTVNWNVIALPQP